MILVISRIGFEGWIWVLIASVPDFCYFLLTSALRLLEPRVSKRMAVKKYSLQDIAKLIYYAKYI